MMLARAPRVVASVAPPPHVYEFASTERFRSQFSEARRQRDALSLGLGSLPEQILEGNEWDGAITALREELLAALCLDVELEELHTALPNFSPAAEHHKSTMAAKEAFLRPLADPAVHTGLLSAYESLVCDVLAPALADSLGAEQELSSLYYACMPTLRVQTPSHDLATIRPHCDGMYGLPAGSVNYWIPLTAVEPTSALWVEDEEVQKAQMEVEQDDGPPPPPPQQQQQQEDASRPFGYRALLRPTRFDGRGLIHFTVPNRSPRTRVSLDFRCVLGHAYDASARLARLGYYSRADRTAAPAGAPAAAAGPGAADGGGGGGGAWLKVESGSVSKLHGLPHRG
jgi:hypothetical protein